MQAAGRTWIMYGFVSVSTCVYVHLHVNSRNAICMRFTHAKISLLFLEKGLFFSPSFFISVLFLLLSASLCF